MRRLAAAVLLAALIGCGKEPEPDPLDTEAYNGWKQGQVLRRLPMARGGLTVKGRIDIQPPEQRSKNKGDFVELFLNGERVGKYSVAKLPDGTWPRISFDMDFNSGPNTFDVWDSSSNRHYRQQVDTRDSVEFLLVPTADGYDIQQLNKKVQEQ